MGLVLSNIKADTIRILKKRSFIIMMMIFLVILVGMCLLAVLLKWEGGKDEAFGLFSNFAAAIQPYMVGIPVFLGVFNDDFSSRALQTAIGRGMSRPKLIICRFIEFILVLCIVYVFFGAVTGAIGVFGNISRSVITDVLKGTSKNMVCSIVYAAFCMILAYSMQSGTLALVVYIIMNAGLIGTLLSVLSMIPFVKKRDIKLEELDITKVLDSAVGGEYWKIAVIVGCYVVLPVCLTILFFRKKELEF